MRAWPLIALLALGCGAETVENRFERLKRELLTSCSCHPKKIDGLPLEQRIDEAIHAAIADGLNDNDILWRVLTQHGNALLRAGIDDLQLRVWAATGTAAFVFAGGLALLILQIGRDRN